MDYYNDPTFPSDDVFEFITMFTGERPENVEVAVTAKSSDGREYWKRYNSVIDPAALRELLSRPGATAHIGACFNAAAAHARQPTTCQIGKPLVFDLDLQDVAQVAV